MSILTLNSGSSSLKMALFNEAQEQTLQGSADGIGKPTGSLKLTVGDRTILEEDHVLESQPEALKKLAAHITATPTAVGHRVVHGGPHLRDHQLITPAVLDQLRTAIHFAPLHI